MKEQVVALCLHSRFILKSSLWVIGRPLCKSIIDARNQFGFSFGFGLIAVLALIMSHSECISSTSPSTPS